jgi:aspartyl protease family protein
MKFHTIISVLLITLLTGCGGCSRSARRMQSGRDDASRRRDTSAPADEENAVQMEKIDGVYQIPVDIDGVPMHFIFDTGAGMISISDTEALFLYKQGKLTDGDFTGSAKFSDANGNITEGTLINLKEVKIGSRVLHNIQASVVDNLKAPLLIGQSALEKFGNVTIDYDRKEIVFK